MKKKLLALFFALTLTLSLCVPAFAGNTTSATTTGSTTLGNGSNEKTSADVVIGSDIKLATIKVTIAAPTSAIVNPFGMSVSVGSTTVSGTLITSPSLITNTSDLKVTVKATPVVTASDGITVKEDGSDASTSDSKTISMTLYMAPQSSDTAAELNGGESNGSSAVIKKSGSGSAEITLDEKNGTNQYGSYQIKGTSGGTDWLTSDTVTTTITFDISPVLNTGSTT